MIDAVVLFRRFSLLVPKDWQKTPIQEHPESVERRSKDPENFKRRRWIELADILLRKRRA